MLYGILILVGVCLGSFVNALVWRLHEQDTVRGQHTAAARQRMQQLSIVRGRSLCAHCGHQLAPKDLVPIVSWLWLRGKCRYCRLPIADTPLPELLLPALFVVSLAAWPYGMGSGWDGWSGWNGWIGGAFIAWLGVLTTFLALALYDARWYVLPDRLMGVASVLSLLMVCLLAVGTGDLAVLRDAVLAGALFFAFLYALWRVSHESWIGGGDVKLAFCLGVVAGTPLLAGLVLFFASLLGVIASLPRVITRTLSIKSAIPFGPWLLLAAVIVFLWGDAIVAWYMGLLLVA